MATVNTTKSVAGGKKNLSQEHQRLLKEANDKFAKQKKAKVTLPENLAPHVGTEAFFSINGVKLILPIGGEYEVPETFAKLIEDWKNNLTR